jgi:DNA-binding response OmpR family regulator
MTEPELAKRPLALIIEDNPAIVKIFRIAMEHAGFEAEQLQDGQVALERLVDVTPTLILLDLHLPYISGEQILDFICSEPRLAETWVILATADLPKAAHLEPKVDFVLKKPFSVYELHSLAKQLRQTDKGSH